MNFLDTRSGRATPCTPPADGSTYMPAMAQASDLAGLDQLEIDVNVTPGIQIKGRVRNTVSGKPVAGELMYYALAGNPRVLGIPVGEFYTQAVEIQQDGTFTIAALPGPGFIGLTVKDGSYPAACINATPLLPKGFNPKPTKDRLWITVGGQGLTSIDQESYQAILLLDVNADKPPGEQHISLTAEPIRGRVLTHRTASH